MGLDNIPHEYPCIAQGTAVRVKSINKETGLANRDEAGVPIWHTDCDETMNRGGCPYSNDMKMEIGNHEGRVLSFLGTSCWYRGKHGNWLLEQAGIYDENTGVSFYGDERDGTYKTPASLMTLADAMRQKIMANNGKMFADDEVEITDDWTYAIWWAEWSSKNTLGSDCWY